MEEIQNFRNMNVKKQWVKSQQKPTALSQKKYSNQRRIKAIKVNNVYVFKE